MTAVAVTAAVAGTAFGVVETATASSARSQVTQTAQQVRQLESRYTSMASRLSAAESAARSAQAEARNASLAHLGVCFSVQYDSSVSWVTSVEIDSPVITDGVYTCPSGDVFASVVPRTVVMNAANG